MGMHVYRRVGPDALLCTFSCILGKGSLKRVSDGGQLALTDSYNDTRSWDVIIVMLVAAVIVGQEQHSRRTRSAPRVLSEPFQTLQADHAMSISPAFH